MKSKAILFASLLLCGTLFSCDDDKNDFKKADSIVYTIESEAPTQALQAIISYTGENGKLINETVDLPAKITIKELDIDTYVIKGYLKTKNSSNYTGKLSYTVSISEVDYKNGAIKYYTEDSSSLTINDNGTPEELERKTAFHLIWQD